MSCVEEIYNQIYSLVSPFLLLLSHEEGSYNLQLVKEYYSTSDEGEKRSLLSLLFRATEAIPITGENKNDPRVLEIWLLYINLSEALGDKNEDELRSFFKFLKSSRVGVRNARFYWQWALFEKRKGEYWMKWLVEILSISHSFLFIHYLTFFTLHSLSHSYIIISSPLLL